MHVRIVWHVFFLKVGRAYRPLEVCSGVLKLPINAWTLDCCVSESCFMEFFTPLQETEEDEQHLWLLWRTLKKQKCRQPKKQKLNSETSESRIFFFNLAAEFWKYFHAKKLSRSSREGKVKNRTTYLKFIKTRWWLLQAHGQWWEKLGGKGVQCIRWETGA